MLRVIVVSLTLILIGAAFSTGAVPPPGTTGFSDPERITSIEEFRLPAWGYRTLQVGLDVYANGAITETDRRVEMTESRLELSPTYERYRESERSVEHLSLGLEGRWRTDRYAVSDTESPHEYKDRYFEVDADVAGEWKRYFRPMHFLSVAAEASGSHTLHHSEDRRHNVDDEASDRTYNKYVVEMAIGFGFGRVRNVTPVVRALRLGERLAALGRVPQLDDEDIRRVADHFAAREAYSRVHDRSGKHFWGGLTGIIEGVDELTPFEAHYISEVFLEKVGDRLEGWETVAGLRLKSRDYYGTDKSAVLSGIARGSWYKNHTLDHQTGFGVSGEVGRHIDGSLESGPEGSVGMFVNHLWVIADRLVWKPEISANVSFRQIEASEGRDEWLKTGQQYKIASDFTYYIEDRMALTSSGVFRIWRVDSASAKGERYIRHDNMWYIRIYLTYYLDRMLSV